MLAKIFTRSSPKTKRNCLAIIFLVMPMMMLSQTTTVNMAVATSNDRHQKGKNMNGQKNIKNLLSTLHMSELYNLLIFVAFAASTHLGSSRLCGSFTYAKKTRKATLFR